MTKKDIVAMMAAKCEVPKTVAEKAVNEVIAEMVNRLSAGEKIQTLELGVLSVKERPARTSRNPRTGEAVEVPAKKTLRLKPSAAVERLLNN